MAKAERPKLKRLSGKGFTEIGPELDTSESLPLEQLKEKAFMFWISLGGGASNKIMGSVGTYIHRGLRTVKEWYAKGEWKARYEAMMRDVSEAHGKIFEESVVMERETMIAITDEGIRRWALQLKLGKIVINRVEDLERLVRIRKMILGESVGGEGVKIEIHTSVPRPQVIDMGKAKVPELPSELETELKTLPMEVSDAGEGNSVSE